MEIKRVGKKEQKEKPEEKRLSIDPPDFPYKQIPEK